MMYDEGTIVTKSTLMKGYWTPFPNEVLFSTVLSQGAKLCYAALEAHVFKSGGSAAWPGQKRLARILHTSVRTIRRYLDELKRVALIRVEQRGLTQSNIYHICDPIAKLLQPLNIRGVDTSVLSDGTPVSAPDGTPVSYKEEEDINDDAEFCKQNSLSSKKQTTGKIDSPPVVEKEWNPQPFGGDKFLIKD